MRCVVAGKRRRRKPQPDHGVAADCLLARGSTEMCYVGWQQSLDNVAQLVEPDIKQ
jgi:hypothetical protein